MTVHAPSSPSERELGLERLLEAVGQASFDSRAWRDLVQTLADELAPGGCEIAFHPRHGRQPAIRLNALRGLSAPGRDGEAEPSERAEPASLTLGTETNGAWRITVWSRARPAAAANNRAQALLDCLGPFLVAAFQTSFALRAGLIPDKSVLRDLWDPLRFGVLLVEPTLRLVFANMAAEDLLHTAALFRPFGGEGAVRPARRENFAALSQACEMVMDGAGSRASFPLLGPRDTPFGEVTVLAASADPFGWGGGHGASASRPSRLLVTLHPFEADAAREDEGLADQFGDSAFRRDARPDDTRTQH